LPGKRMDSKDLRRSLIRRRRRTPADVLRRASGEVARLAWQLPALRRARRIGMYFAVGGEIDCGALLARAHATGRQVYFPVLHGPALRFAAYRPGDLLVTNRYGIGEPRVDARQLLRGSQLDVVLTPLVAFDRRGNRLGMGAGYYDRSFAFRRRRTAWQRPRLIGLAHEFQRVESLRAQSWDVPLDAVVTDRQVYQF